MPDAILLSRKATAALLGMPQRSFDRLCASGKFGPEPVVLAGVKFLRAEVEAWVGSATNGELPDRRRWQELKRVRQRAAG